MDQLTLPNGMEIAYLDKLTAIYCYNEIFKDAIYLDKGISIKDGDVIFDVGANIGLFSKYVDSKINNAMIYAFEPVPPIFKALSIPCNGKSLAWKA